MAKPLKACSQRAKANAKAKRIKEQSEEIKKISGKHQRHFSLSRSLSLGVGRPLKYNGLFQFSKGSYCRQKFSSESPSNYKFCNVYQILMVSGFPFNDI